MRVSSLIPLLAAAVAPAVEAKGNYSHYAGPGYYHDSPYPAFSGNMFQKYNLSANGIRASFIPYGARCTNMYVKDRNGNYQDIVVGYDTGVQYLHDTETNHTYFGAVVGRYANRYVGIELFERVIWSYFNVESRTARSPSMVKHTTSQRMSTAARIPYTVVSLATISKIGPLLP